MNEITLESIAKHCIDDNITVDQIAYLLKVQAELERLRALEKALRSITDLPLARPWHVLGSIVKQEGYQRWGEIIDAIADALEVEL